jgi:large subunit ribosomal protein L5
MTIMQENYKETIVKTLTDEFGITNVMAVPKLVKIVINVGLGEALKEKKSLELMGAQLAAITGQKAQVTRAKQSISTFKLRAGEPIGLKITLRGKRMYEFFTKLIAIALPRVRDFRGVPVKGFDGHGNYTLGVKEQTMFPDLDYKLVDKVRGFEATFVTTAPNDAQGKKLLELFGLPFEKEKK